MASTARTGSGFWLSSRFGLAVIGFFGFANLYAQRVNLSVAMVCMLNRTELAIQSAKQNNVTSYDVSHNLCDSNSSQSSSNKEDGEFAWPKYEQGLILGSFFWGYMITQIPGGLLAERFGGKPIYMSFMAVCAISTLLSPLAARVHFGFLMALRIICGLGEGVAYPCMHSLWSKWAPPLERSILVGFTYAGSQIGNVITFPVSGVLCDELGWASIFYVFGSLGLVWCLAWQILVSNSPAEHRRIRHDEKEYIFEQLQGQVDQEHTDRKEKVPWRSIMTSLPFLAILVAHVCGNFGTYIVLTGLPTFMKEALDFDIKSNGLYSAIPYVAYWFGINAAGFVSDFLRSRKILSTGHVRKLMMIIAMSGQSAFLVAAGYCGCGQEILAVAFITIAQGISGIQYSGFVVNHVDIAPRYAGTLFGITNTFATISGIVAPSVTAALTEHGTRAEWRSVFWVSTGILMFGALFFAIFASGELQPWAKEHEKSSDGAVGNPGVELESQITEVHPHQKISKEVT